tara:strand:+ start:744 stop:1100 length:357 start_codon:yes stop_codon:yes gene_type:complete
LNKYTALKTFLKDEVEKGAYKNVKVEWKRGAIPTAHFYDENGRQVLSRFGFGSFALLEALNSFTQVLEAVIGNLQKEEIPEFFAFRGFQLRKLKSEYSASGEHLATFNGHEYEVAQPF